ncbi:MAG: hypothetical protein ACLRWP_04265 [Bilophila wadsworthia]
MAKNRERRSASSEMFSGQARTRGQGVNELVELIGLPAAIELIRPRADKFFRSSRHHAAWAGTA